MAAGLGVFGRERGGAAHIRHVERYAALVDMLEDPILAPLFDRQRPSPAIDFAHCPDVPERISKKARPFRRMLAWIRAFDAKHSDKLLAVFLFAFAAEI